MIDKTKDRFWEVSIRVRVDEITDFDYKKLYQDVKKCAEASLGGTSWEYETSATPHYPTKYDSFFCDDCGGNTTHISSDGDDFVCLVCEDKKRKGA